MAPPASTQTFSSGRSAIAASGGAAGSGKGLRVSPPLWGGVWEGRRDTSPEVFDDAAVGLAVGAEAFLQVLAAGEGFKRGLGLLIPRAIAPRIVAELPQPPPELGRERGIDRDQLAG